MTRTELALVKRMVWPPDAVRPNRVYAVVDCARHPSVYQLVTRSYREKVCLFAGKLDPALERSAPFLLELHAGDSTSDELLLQGWHDFWGIVLRSEASFETVHRHLRTLLRVRTEDGRFLLFRWYDPRVLNLYLPTCTAEELATFFGELNPTFFTTGETGGNVQTFHLEAGGLCRSLML